jgi:hypothetical protein
LKQKLLGLFCENLFQVVFGKEEIKHEQKKMENAIQNRLHLLWQEVTVQFLNLHRNTMTQQFEMDPITKARLLDRSVTLQSDLIHLQQYDKVMPTGTCNIAVFGNNGSTNSDGSLIQVPFFLQQLQRILQTGPLVELMRSLPVQHQHLQFLFLTLTKWYQLYERLCTSYAKCRTWIIQHNHEHYCFILSHYSESYALLQSLMVISC